MESSSSERRDESEESRSGSARDRPRRGSRRAARPMTHPHRPPPPSISPRRSPQLTQSSAARDLRNLPLAAKSDRRTATLDRLVEMSTDDDRADRRGVHQTMDGRARVGCSSFFSFSTSLVTGKSSLTVLFLTTGSLRDIVL